MLKATDIKQTDSCHVA